MVSDYLEFSRASGDSKSVANNTSFDWLNKRYRWRVWMVRSQRYARVWPLSSRGVFGLLRTGELLTLRAQDIFMANATGPAVLSLGLTKGGAQQASRPMSAPSSLAFGSGNNVSLPQLF